MKVELCHTLSTEIIQIDIPEVFVKDLKHVVIISEGEAYQLKSTIPDEIKKKNKLRQEFEDKEFEYLRTNYYSDLDENTDPDDFEEDFVDHAKNLVYGNYPELQSLVTDDIFYHTICTHFVLYAVHKNREEKLNKKNEKQKSDKCYAKDFAKRLINLFRVLSFSDPSSIKTFSDELSEVEQFMRTDSRRHAGYDKLFFGISSTVNQLANAFITNEGEQKINIVKAFEDVASSPDNPDRQKLIAKISGIIDNTITYYENYILSIDKTEEEIATISDDVSLAYIAVARGLVVGFINATDAFLKTYDNTADAATKEASMKKYKTELEQFCGYFDDLVASFDDATDNTVPDTAFANSIGCIWFSLDQAKSSDDENWPTTLAKQLFNDFNQLFKDVPTDLKMKQKSN